MEKEIITTRLIKTPSGKDGISVDEILNEMKKIEKKDVIEQKKDNIIYLSDHPKFKEYNQWNWEGYEYVDAPNNMEDNEYESTFDEIIEILGIQGLLDRCSKCIEDGKKIIARRKKGGKKR